MFAKQLLRLIVSWPLTLVEQISRLLGPGLSEVRLTFSHPRLALTCLLLTIVENFNPGQ